MLRASTAADIPAIAAIYGHHVLHGTASFETEPPAEEEMARRREDVVRRGLPHLVVDLDGVVAGFAYAAPYRPRPAYRFTVEDSIYIHPDHLRQGLGGRLLPAIIDACAEQGYRQMLAVIGDSANFGSIRLHQSFGFQHAGTLHDVGYKFDRWLDTVLMQRAL